jgi:beta-lactamase regulating signal transducer with metallopeptidase domain/HEAT repeat protein
MVPSLVSDIVALPGWNTPMLLLLAKTTLILLCALAITVAMYRSSAGARHLVWLVTLGTLLLVPAMAAWAPPLRLEILPSVVQVASPAAPVAATDSKTLHSDVAAPVASDSRTIEPNSGSGAVDGVTLSRFSGISIFFAIWAAIAFAIAMWLAYGALTVRRIVRNAQPLDTQDWLTPLWEVADRLELEEPPRLLGSDEAKMPFACGFTRPTIVLPSECEQWSEDRRRAVLLHELAHVKRRDLIGHTLGRLACAVYWFHPLVWSAAKQLRNESERACDDLAISCGARASDYAEHLLDIVTSVRHDSTPAIALAMARRKEFEGRMLAILDPELRHSTPGRKQVIGLIASLATIAIVVGAAAPAPRASRTIPLLSATMAAADSEFTPRDVPSEHEDDPTDRVHDQLIDKSVGKGIDKAVNKTVNKAVNKSVNESISSSVARNTFSSLSEAVSSTILQSVGQAIGDVDAASVALRALRDGGISGVMVRNGRGAPDDRPVLLATVLRTDTDAALRRTAAWGLSEYADTDVASEALSTALRRDSDAGVREMCAWALSESSGGSAAVSALAAAMRQDANDNVRATATWALGRVESRNALDDLTAVLSDRNKRVRTRAIWALGQIEPREAPKALVALLRDPDPDIRKLTAWALFRIEDPSTSPALNAALKGETDKDLQIAYIKAIAALGEKSVDAIRELLTSSDPRIKSMAVRALAGGHGAGPWPWPWPEPRPFP